jgi:lipoyl synthase
MGRRMLRTRVEYKRFKADQDVEKRWRVSSGSAVVLGLAEAHLGAAPTTAYLMLGDRCKRNCAFCTQARDSSADEATLSRVSWPDFDAEETAVAVAEAFEDGRIVRTCFQVTVSQFYLEQTELAVRALARRSKVPICASVAPRSSEDVAPLLKAGAERVTIALDAACERIYRTVKGGSWTQTTAVLEESARRFPGHVGTHLIVGLGETEREMVERMQYLADLGVSIGLFAFTPVAGTALAEREQPPLGQYRRMQAACWLVVNTLARADTFAYDTDDRLLSLGLSPDRLHEVLGDGQAFRTSGCPGCNRPYYNERPGGVLYNYPRPLTPEEATREFEALLASVGGKG